MRQILLLIAFLFVAADATAQTRSVLEYTGIVLTGTPRPGIQLRDQGRRAIIKGDEFGNFRVSAGGHNLVDDLHLAFRLGDSGDVIEGSTLAKRVVKRPEGLTIVYSHPAFTVRQHVLVPLHEPAAIILLDVETVAPLEVVVRMKGDSSGNVLVGMPPGVPFPYVLRFDAAQTHDYIPIVIAGGAADSVALTHERLATNARQYWREKVTHYSRRTNLFSVETPDPILDQAMEWARVGLDDPANADGLATFALNSLGQFESARIVLTDPNVPATALWLLACYEYWITSGDESFLREMWPNISGAFKRLADRDTNGDGLIEDPHSDIHLAGIWLAALDGMQPMARAMKDAITQARASQMATSAQGTLESAFWSASAGLYASRTGRPHILMAWPAIPMAFAVLDAERSGRMLREISSSAIAADWGVRALSPDDSLYDPLLAERGAVTAAITGYAAMAHYRHHRAWSGFDLVRDIARMALDFERGRSVNALSGAYYQALDSASVQVGAGSAMLVWPFIKGMIGWQVDAQHRAAALEPHLPADWGSLRIGGLRMGRDRIAATVTRERGIYAISLRRMTAGPALSMRIAPALPLGARVERIVVDDQDVSVQAEESAHDVHAVADVTLLRDSHIEFHYEGGIEVISPPEQIAAGDASHHLRVLDFRRDGRDYVLVLEGRAGAAYTLQLRAETKLRTTVGTDSFEQDDDRVTLRVTMPAGAGFSRKAVRLRP